MSCVHACLHMHIHCKSPIARKMRGNTNNFEHHLLRSPKQLAFVLEWKSSNCSRINPVTYPKMLCFWKLRLATETSEHRANVIAEIKCHIHKITVCWITAEWPGPEADVSSSGVFPLLPMDYSGFALETGFWPKSFAFGWIRQVDSLGQMRPCRIARDCCNLLFSPPSGKTVRCCGYWDLTRYIYGEEESAVPLRNWHFIFSLKETPVTSLRFFSQAVSCISVTS